MTRLAALSLCRLATFLAWTSRRIAWASYRCAVAGERLARRRG